MSDYERGVDEWEEEGMLKYDEIGMEIVFNWGGSHSFNLHKASGETWRKYDFVQA